MTPLSGWQNFYVIVGSSAGALIGLQFVVMALIADLPRGPGAAQAGQAFATPTIVHFSSVLLLSAALCAPWHGMEGVGSSLGPARSEWKCLRDHRGAANAIADRIPAGI